MSMHIAWMMRTSYRVRTGVRADYNSSQTNCFADEDGEERHHAIHHEACKSWGPSNCSKSSQGEHADDEGRVMVRRTSEEESERRPVAREGCRSAEANQACLHEHWVFEGELDDVPRAELGYFLTMFLRLE